MTVDTHSGSRRPLWARAFRTLERAARGGARDLCMRCVRTGVNPKWVGWRHVEAVPLTQSASGYWTIHPPRREVNPLPGNFQRRDELPDDPYWWGYSMRDVPDRLSDETFAATFRDATIAFHRDDQGQFYPGILSQAGHAINLREIRFRPGHSEMLRRAKPARRDRAVWLLERVHENHSHWLTAHLPKFLLARNLGLLEHVLLPERLKPAQEASLRMLGIDPDAFACFDETRPLLVSDLTLLGTDRFRPDLLRPVRDVMAPALPPEERMRRIYISRARARFRKLLNEDEIWPILETRGFERIFMEDLDFAAQVDLMRRAECLVAPHGAGLTNMMFCAEGTKIVEIASLGFPNPNFYALAAAMGLSYHLLPAEEHGNGRPLERDLSVSPPQLARVVDMIAPSRGGA